MQVPSLFLKVKKYMFGGKVQGVEVSQVCGWAVTRDNAGFASPGNALGRTSLVALQRLWY